MRFVGVDLAWAIAGVTMVIIALFNLVVIVLLGSQAFRLLKHYDAQRKEGVDPVFLAEDMPDLKNVECWKREDVDEYLEKQETQRRAL